MNNTLTTYEKAKLFDKIASKMKKHKNLSVDLDLQSLGENLSIWPTEKNFEEVGSVNNQEFG